MKTEFPSSIVPPDQAEVIRAYGDEVSIHLGEKHNGGVFTMFTDITPPAGGPPPHFHTLEDEWFHVLEGQIEFLIDGVWSGAVPVGTTVFAPRNSFHTFRNAGDTPHKMLMHTAPSGFESFFKKSETEFHKEGGPDMARILQIGAEFGIYFPTISAADEAKRGPQELPVSIVRPGEGRVCRMFGEEVVILLDSKQTGGKFTSFIDTTQPGGGPPPHYLADQDEWLFVLEGKMSFFNDGKWVDAPAGTAFFSPRNSVHTFKNVGDTPSKMLVHVTPCGIEDFFIKAHDEFAKPGGPDMALAMQIAQDHGIIFV